MAVSGDAKRKKLNSLMQNINKALIVVFELEYSFPTPAVVHYAAPGVWILYAKRISVHNGRGRALGHTGAILPPGLF